nr:MAG TPA: hypothetical protein [Caudoviricetes sp.]
MFVYLKSNSHHNYLLYLVLLQISYLVSLLFSSPSAYSLALYIHLHIT